MATTLLSLLKSRSPHFCAAIAKQEFTYNPLPGEEPATVTDNKEAEQTVSYEVEFKEVSAGGKLANMGQLSAEKKQKRYVHKRNGLACILGRNCRMSVLLVCLRRAPCLFG